MMGLELASRDWHGTEKHKIHRIKAIRRVVDRGIDLLKLTLKHAGWIALHPPGSSPAMHFWQILGQLHAALAVNELHPSLAMNSSCRFEREVNMATAKTLRTSCS
jgi:hypothetical protein